MTVKNLIERLEDMPPEKPVRLLTESGWADVELVVDGKDQVELS